MDDKKLIGGPALAKTLIHRTIERAEYDNDTGGLHLFLSENKQLILSVKTEGTHFNPKGLRKIDAHIVGEFIDG